jgi:hypothetical protein
MAGTGALPKIVIARWGNSIGLEFTKMLRVVQLPKNLRANSVRLSGACKCGKWPASSITSNRAPAINAATSWPIGGGQRKSYAPEAINTGARIAPQSAGRDRVTGSAARNSPLSIRPGRTHLHREGGMRSNFRLFPVLCARLWRPGTGCPHALARRRHSGRPGTVDGLPLHRASLPYTGAARMVPPCSRWHGCPIPCPCLGLRWCEVSRLPCRYALAGSRWHRGRWHGGRMVRCM